MRTFYDYQKLYMLNRDCIYSRMIEVQAGILDPINVKGFTEISRLEGEKRAMKREVEFLRAILETMDEAMKKYSVSSNTLKTE